VGGVFLLGEIWPLVDPKKKGWELSKGIFFGKKKGKSCHISREKKTLN
jgi:hypothetical protein